MTMIIIDPHPLLELGAFKTLWPAALESVPSPPWLLELLATDSAAPLTRDETVRLEARNLLRHGGYKPTGRGKPASEYLVKAASDGRLASINTAVDCCNAVSLHSGLPISMVDLARTEPPLRVGIAPPDARYVFNAAGQEIRVEGLLCLHDQGGPCANGVKDSQRTKTGPGTTQTLSLVWGSRSLGERTNETTDWYRQLLERLGATTSAVALQASG